MSVTIPSNLNEIREKVEADGGVSTMSMATVRDAYGAGRLGVHVRTNISKELRGLGLGHLPEQLPDSQSAPVRVYKLGTPIADLIDAARHPSKDGDQKLREAVSGETETVLARIRELVCQ